MTKKLWPFETDPDDPSVPHVTVPCARCPTHFFVAENDPRLPDGPFYCCDHQDTPPSGLKVPDTTEASVICDRCNAELTTRAPTREAALAQLVDLIAEKRWSTTIDGAPKDLCFTCVSS